MSLNLICNSFCRFLLPAILFTYTSCKTAPAPVLLPAPSPAHASLSESDNAFVAEFAKKLNVDYMVFACKIYDLTGKKVAAYNGQLCWFEEDGGMFAAPRRYIFKLDRTQKAVWVKNPAFFHHTFRKSEFKDEFLTLNSEYLSTKEFPSVRFDELIVMGRDGKIIKSFKFSRYDRISPFPRPPRIDEWSVDKVFDSKEFTHGNSFSEVWKVKNGRKVHTGYVYYSNAEEFIYFLNPSLTKVTKKVNVAGRKLHTVHQYNEKQLIAYGNSGEKNGTGGIYLIDMKNSHFHELYKFTEKRQGSVSCGSVQFFEDSRLFIVHSKCEEPQGNNTHVEFVDLKKGRNVILWLDMAYPPISGELANLSQFFANTYSQ